MVSAAADPEVVVEVLVVVVAVGFVAAEVVVQDEHGHRELTNVAVVVEDHKVNHYKHY